MNEIFHRRTNKYNPTVKTGTQSEQPRLQHLTLQKTKLQARHTQSLQANNPKQQTHPTTAKEEALKAKKKKKKEAINSSQKQQIAMNISPGSKIQVLPRALKTALRHKSHMNISFNLC
jgi:hypothetical protein